MESELFPIKSFDSLIPHVSRAKLLVIAGLALSLSLYIFGTNSVAKTVECRSNKTSIKLIEINTVCISGIIQKNSYNEFIETIKNNNIKTIYINSLGGDVDEAISIARFISENRIDVIVSDFCFSSCANYLFVSGNKKQITTDGVVAWHGVPIFNPALVSSDHADVIRAIVEKSDNFFKEFGVNSFYFSHVPPEIKEKLSRYGRNKGWTYTQKFMESRIGIKNISWNDERLSQNINRIEKTFSIFLELIR